MARTEVFVADLPFQSSQNPSFIIESVDAVNGMMYANDGDVVCVVQNGNLVSGTVDVTLTGVADRAGRIATLEATVPVDRGQIFGPLRPRYWNQTSGDDIGKVYIDFSTSSNIFIYVYRLFL